MIVSPCAGVRVMRAPANNPLVRLRRDWPRHRDGNHACDAGGWMAGLRESCPYPMNVIGGNA